MIKKWPCREAIVAAAVLAGFLVVFFANAIFTGKALVSAGNIFMQPFYRQYAPQGFTRAPNILLDDQHVQFYPAQHSFSQRLQQKEIPLWNPNILLGVPVNGTAINAVFYPWNLFMVILPLSVVLWLRAFLNLWVAGFFTFLFVRRAGASKAGAYLSAVSFMLCGFMIAWLGHPQSSAAAWLPALVYFIELFFTAVNFRKIYAILAAVAMSFVFFAGHMETAFQVCLVSFLFYLVRAFQAQGLRQIGKNLVIAAGVLSLTVLLAAVQIVPFLEWLRISAEFAARSASKFVLFDWRHFLQLPSLIALYLPNFLINPSQIDFPLINLVPWGNFSEVALYVGVLPLVIGMQGFWREIKNNKMIFLFGAGGLFCLCLAFRLPIFDWVNQLPIFNMFAPRRWRLVFDLGMAVTAGLSFDLWVAQLSENKNCKKIVQGFIVCGILAIIAVVAVKTGLSYFEQPIIERGQAYAQGRYLASAIHSRPLDQVLADVAVLFNRVVNYFSLANWRLYFPGIVLIVAAGLILALRKKRLKPETFKYGLVALTAIDLCVLWIGYNPVIAPKDLYPITPAIEFLQQDKSIFRILPVRSEWVSSAPMVYGLSELGGADLPTKYYDDFTDAIEGKDGQGFEFFAVQSANSRLIDLMNVKYIVTTNKFDPAPERDIKLRWQQDGVYLYENRKVMPRAFIVHKARTIAENKLIEELNDPQFDPRQEVLFVQENIGSLAENISMSQERVNIVKYRPEQVTVQVRAAGKGLLVISDSYYPGWRAYRGKQEIPVYRANGAMRAVEVVAGDQQIEFRYQPRSIYFGGAISLGAFFMAALMIAVFLRKRRNNVL